MGCFDGFFAITVGACKAGGGRVRGGGRGGGRGSGFGALIQVRWAQMPDMEGTLPVI